MGKRPIQMSKYKKKVTAAGSLQNDKWVTEFSVAALYNVSQRTLRNWRLNEGLPGSRIGKMIFYKESDLHALFEKRQKVVRRSKNGKDVIQKSESFRNGPGKTVLKNKKKQKKITHVQ
jgi:hypothetical protein